MTKKRNPEPTSGNTSEVNNLDELEMFREVGDSGNDYSEDHGAEDFEDDYEFEGEEGTDPTAVDMDLAAVEEALQEAEDVLDTDASHDGGAWRQRRVLRAWVHGDGLRLWSRSRPGGGRRSGPSGARVDQDGNARAHRMGASPRSRRR